MCEVIEGRTDQKSPGPSIYAAQWEDQSLRLPGPATAVSGDVITSPFALQRSTVGNIQNPLPGG